MVVMVKILNTSEEIERRWLVQLCNWCHVEDSGTSNVILHDIIIEHPCKIPLLLLPLLLHSVTYRPCGWYRAV